LNVSQLAYAHRNGSRGSIREGDFRLRSPNHQQNTEYGGHSKQAAQK
jgi:hypothetical protein